MGKIEAKEIKVNNIGPKFKYTLSEEIEKIDFTNENIKENQDFQLECPKEMACSTVRKNKISIKDGKNYVKYFLSSGLGEELSKAVCTSEISELQGLSGNFCYCRCHRIEVKNFSSEVIKNRLITKKGLKAESIISINPMKGYIGIDTKAKISFIL